jgi:hypothetical protein
VQYRFRDGEKYIAVGESQVTGGDRLAVKRRHRAQGLKFPEPIGPAIPKRLKRIAVEDCQAMFCGTLHREAPAVHLPLQIPQWRFS